eukprot:GEMP01060596.1.p1 GENE.GEMP01060596.1~~GEMP01060596.1.p1  ORF type:complete len:202 (-),score=17.47 GEMP01060596.1:40-645(-)
MWQRFDACIRKVLPHFASPSRSMPSSALPLSRQQSVRRHHCTTVLRSPLGCSNRMQQQQLTVGTSSGHICRTGSLATGSSSHSWRTFALASGSNSHRWRTGGLATECGPVRSLVTTCESRLMRRDIIYNGLATMVCSQRWISTKRRRRFKVKKMHYKKYIKEGRYLSTIPQYEGVIGQIKKRPFVKYYVQTPRLRIFKRER